MTKRIVKYVKTLILLPIFIFSISLSAQMIGMSMSSDNKMQECMNMMTKDLGPKGANYDKRFIDMMIPHHEGAIAMAKDALQKTNRPEIKQLAKNIIKAQEQEIAQMKKWRKEWYGV